MQILIPMAGAGSRFAKVGYSKPKPLIDVDGLPMISRVIDNLGPDNDYIFIVQKSVLDDYEKDLISATDFAKSSKFLIANGLTEGAAQTCLLAKDSLDMDSPLMIANCDQIMDWNYDHFYKWFDTTFSDGSIITFSSIEPNNSYVTLREDGYILEAQEKIVISDIATTGVYIWRQARDFMVSAEEMISKNIRYNNEFYVCPVYNQIVEKGKLINVYHIKSHWPIGTPEDLEIYLKHRHERI